MGKGEFRFHPYPCNKAALWNVINSIVVGALIFAVLYGVGFWAWKQDPNMLEILRASAKFRARYDPALAFVGPARYRRRRRFSPPRPGLPIAAIPG